VRAAVGEVGDEPVEAEQRAARVRARRRLGAGRVDHGGRRGGAAAHQPFALLGAPAPQGVAEQLARHRERHGELELGASRVQRLAARRSGELRDRGEEARLPEAGGRRDRDERARSGAR
jgi:hypothetical protein